MKYKTFVKDFYNRKIKKYRCKDLIIANVYTDKPNITKQVLATIDGKILLAFDYEENMYRIFSQWFSSRGPNRNTRVLHILKDCPSNTIVDTENRFKLEDMMSVKKYALFNKYQPDLSSITNTGVTTLRQGIGKLYYPENGHRINRIIKPSTYTQFDLVKTVLDLYPRVEDSVTISDLMSGNVPFCRWSIPVVRKDDHSDEPEAEDLDYHRPARHNSFSSTSFDDLCDDNDDYYIAVLSKKIITIPYINDLLEKIRSEIEKYNAKTVSENSLDYNSFKKACYVTAGLEDQLVRSSRASLPSWREFGTENVPDPDAVDTLSRTYQLDANNSGLIARSADMPDNSVLDLPQRLVDRANRGRRARGLLPLDVATTLNADPGGLVSYNTTYDFDDTVLGVDPYVTPRIRPTDIDF